jgi:hypothetical protein
MDGLFLKATEVVKCPEVLLFHNRLYSPNVHVETSTGFILVFNKRGISGNNPAPVFKPLVAVMVSHNLELF